MPSYKWWETAFYGIGLKLYDLLAGKSAIGSTQFLNKQEVLDRLPQVQMTGLRGGVQYWDGQFDDARLALEIARTAQKKGALVLNYCSVESLDHAHHKLSGLKCKDAETGSVFDINAKCVINATGVWVDGIRAMDAESSGEEFEPMVTPSQGVHLVVDRSFLSKDFALLVPSTQDGRVLFAVPLAWKSDFGYKLTLGVMICRLNPWLFRKRWISFCKSHLGICQKLLPVRMCVAFGLNLRPLVKPQKTTSGNTKGLSREHTILVSESGLVTVTGGKWTTYRAMAEDVIQQCLNAGLISKTDKQATTADCPLVGTPIPKENHASIPLTNQQGNHSYGTEQSLLSTLPGCETWLCEGLSEAMVRFAVRYEYARTVEDVLARRSRLLFLDAQFSVGSS
jgi:glycerol-3-phosphate dehydrogenase